MKRFLKTKVVLVQKYEKRPMRRIQSQSFQFSCIVSRYESCVSGFMGHQHTMMSQVGGDSRSYYPPSERGKDTFSVNKFSRNSILPGRRKGKYLNALKMGKATKCGKVFLRMEQNQQDQCSNIESLSSCTLTSTHQIL